MSIKVTHAQCRAIRQACAMQIINPFIKNSVKGWIYIYFCRGAEDLLNNYQGEGHILHKQPSKEKTLEQAMLPLRPFLGNSTKRPKSEREQNSRDQEYIKRRVPNRLWPLQLFIFMHMKTSDFYLT